jgi:hypothetical protein
MRGLMSPAIDPVSQFLRRLGVSMSMDRRVRQLPPVLDHQQFDELQKNPPTWLLLRKTRPRPQLIFTADLIRWKEARSGSESEPESGDKNATEQSIDLQDIPVQRRDIAPISARATLLGALRKMEGKNLDALYVVSVHSGRVLGIITRQAIERSYRNPMS